MISYRWAKLAPVGVASMLVAGVRLSNVFTKINYEAVATDGENAVWSAGTAHLGPPVPEQFVAAQDVTADQKAAWLEAALGPALGVLQQNLAGELSQAVGTTVFAGETASAAFQSTGG